MKIDHLIVALTLSASLAGASIIPFLAGSPQPSGGPPTTPEGFGVDINLITVDTNEITADVDRIPATADLNLITVDTNQITADKN